MEEKKWNELSFGEIADSVEKFGKIAAVGTGILYVLGFLIYANYYNKLHIRSFELLQTTYFFAAFYYLTFLAINLGVDFTLVLARSLLRCVSSLRFQHCVHIIVAYPQPKINSHDIWRVTR